MGRENLSFHKGNLERFVVITAHVIHICHVHQLFFRIRKVNIITTASIGRRLVSPRQGYDIGQAAQFLNASFPFCHRNIGKAYHCHTFILETGIVVRQGVVLQTDYRQQINEKRGKKKLHEKQA